jgi:hypothetical protein
MVGDKYVAEPGYPLSTSEGFMEEGSVNSQRSGSRDHVPPLSATRASPEGTNDEAVRSGAENMDGTIMREGVYTSGHDDDSFLLRSSKTCDAWWRLICSS